MKEKTFKPKYATEEQVAEINELFEDHGEALTAFALDCAQSNYEYNAPRIAIGAVLAYVVFDTVVDELIKPAYRKWKDRKKDKTKKV